MKQYKKLLKALAHIQVTHPVLTVLFIISLSIGMIAGSGQVRTVASLEQMMPYNVPEIKAFNILRDNILGQDTIAIVIELNRDAERGIQDITDYRIYTYINEVSSYLEQQSDILEVYSFSTLIGHDLDEESYHHVVESTDLNAYVNPERTITMVIATTDVATHDERMLGLAQAVKRIISDQGYPPGTEIKLTGTPIIQQRLGELIQSDRASTQWISTLLVFLITALIFGTFSSAVVPILVVTISVNWLYGTMGYANLPISTLAGGVAAMVIGIGIDFAIHIMNKFRYERKKGLSIAESIEMAVVETGTALTATSITTITAFLAFLVGVMPEMGRFGILMAIGISYSLVFSVFGLPALLVIEEKVIGFLKRKMRFGVEGEYKLARDNHA